MTDDLWAAQEKIRHLGDHINSLVDEKANLQIETDKLRAANERLATELKAVIAEKEELRKQLALKSGLGIHENRPGPMVSIRARGPVSISELPPEGDELKSSHD